MNVSNFHSNCLVNCQQDDDRMWFYCLRVVELGTAGIESFNIKGSNKRGILGETLSVWKL